MNKLASIGFLLLILFHMIGYKIIFYSLHHKVDSEMSQRLDMDDYAPNETITFKIPVSLPYPAVQEGYQKVSGVFEYKGAYYNLIKQKIANDTLYAVCVVNTEKTKLSEAISDVEIALHDLPVSKSGKSQNLLNTLTKDYLPAPADQGLVYGGYQLSLGYPQLVAGSPQYAVSTFSPPPEPIIC